MDAFSLLKYWRGSGASTAHATSSLTYSSTSNASINGSNAIGETIHEITESDEEVHADDGPFFDMEFTVDGDERARNNEFGAEFDGIHESDDESDECDCENDNEEAGELKFTLSSASSGDSIDPNISLSPSDDLFFKGKLVPLSEPEPDSNIKPVSKSSSTKLRVLMLKLKKSTKPRSENEQNAGVEDAQDVKYKPEKKDVVKSSTKLFTVKFKVDEVPVLSMFTRDNSSKVSNTKTNKENVEKSSIIEEEEKVFSKDMVNKYLKPLYFRVSKRYGEKLGFSGAGTPKVSESMGQVRNVKSQKHGISLPGKLRVVRKQLGKSKSASSTVTAAADSPPLVMVAKRRDDSLLQQQDGIQSAILHCKRSFKASRELERKGGCEGNENVTKADLSCSADKAKGDVH